MAKYFGTDGIRGKYGEKLDEALAYRTGLALGEYFGKGKFTIGRDTRVSGEELERGLVKGITDAGGEAILLGILPTPAVAFLTIRYGAKCGVMISASHNPPEYNGIKVFDRNGVKLTEEQEGSVEYYIDNLPVVRGSGKVVRAVGGRQEYVDYVVKTVNADFRGLEVWLDCGYGAASTVAEEAFRRSGATVNVDNCSLRGEKINSGCGALHPDYVRNSMRGSSCRLGFAFDGDADRLAVVADGEILDGDSVLYNIQKGMTLSGDTVVGTVLNNLALEKRLEKDGRRLVRTPVGDKYICDLMFREGYNVGGEQSGHYIVYPAATTGDGIMSAMFFAKSLYSDGKLTSPEKLDLVPQKAIAEYADPSIMFDDGLRALTEKAETKLGTNGRIIVRYSGTEPKIRVMIESVNSDAVDSLLAEFKAYISKRR